MGRFVQGGRGVDGSLRPDRVAGLRLTHGLPTRTRRRLPHHDHDMLQFSLSPLVPPPALYMPLDVFEASALQAFGEPSIVLQTVSQIAAPCRCHSYICAIGTVTL
jgi:hypothetical protein